MYRRGFPAPATGVGDHCGEPPAQVRELRFKLFVTDAANFKAAAGSLTVFLVPSGYVYRSTIIFLVGVKVDELLRADATEGQRGMLGIPGIAK